jgi:hypothetical protein
MGKQAPAWAQKLAAEVAASHDKVPPSIVWVRRNRTESSGMAYVTLNKVVIQAGTDPLDLKLVVLHELAHCLLPNSEKHGPRFWDKAFELFQHYGLKPDHFIERSLAYKAGALAAAKRAGLEVPQGVAMRAEQARRRRKEPRVWMGRCQNCFQESRDIRERRRREGYWRIREFLCPTCDPKRGGGL